jgi:predicted lipoprotein with Yx(FWY)xxD motif
MIVSTRSTRARSAQRVFALAAIAAITLAACGDDDDATPAAATTEAAAAATDAPAAAATTAPAAGRGDYDYGSSGATATTAAAAAGGEASVLVADTSLGQVLTASNGMTVYLFMPDAQGAPTCTDACANAWPPATVDDAASVSGGDGVDASLLGTADHPSGTTQLTYNGWPLYFFAGDSAPGDVNGEGSGGVWYVLDPTGNPIDND